MAPKEDKQYSHTASQGLVVPIMQPCIPAETTADLEHLELASSSSDLVMQSHLGYPAHATATSFGLNDMNFMCFERQ